MNRGWFILVDHEPVPADIHTCATFLSNLNNRVIKRESIEGNYQGHLIKVEVSKVFLGLDHQYEEGGPPLLFETMLFCAAVPEVNGAQMRCATYAEALEQHEEMKAQVRLKWKPESLPRRRFRFH